MGKPVGGGVLAQAVMPTEPVRTNGKRHSRLLRAGGVTTVLDDLSMERSIMRF